jgi:hypothetical protein
MVAHPILTAITNWSWRAILIIAVGIAAVVTGWRYTHPVTGTLTARIVLNGAVCDIPSHQFVCRAFAHGGAVVIYGPPRHGDALPNQHVVYINSADTLMTLHLRPGTYTLDFTSGDQKTVLLPNLGDFTIHAHQTTALGQVEPALAWLMIRSH